MLLDIIILLQIRLLLAELMNDQAGMEPFGNGGSAAQGMEEHGMSTDCESRKVTTVEPVATGFAFHSRHLRLPRDTVGNIGGLGDRPATRI